MDIVITTPKSQMANAAQEAADCIANGGGHYFRRFSIPGPKVQAGDNVFYVEDGYVRGFCKVERTAALGVPKRCDTTGQWWQPGFYIFMRADSWHWIEPIYYQGFRGYQYANFRRGAVVVVGGWKSPRPKGELELI